MLQNYEIIKERKRKELRKIGESAGQGKTFFEKLQRRVCKY